MTREDAIKYLKRGTTESFFNDDADKFMEAYHMAIKALEKELSEDCVSRKAVLETIDDCNSDGLKGIFCSYDDGERFKEYIKALPPVEPTQKWIPCSERLPKEIGFYLVSTTDCITIMEFNKGWISQNLGSCNWYVKAWQPLPEPYKENEQLLSYADQDTMQPAT